MASRGELVIEDRTLFHQVGWYGHNDHKFYNIDGQAECRLNNLGGYAPTYIQIATDHGEGWDD